MAQAKARNQQQPDAPKDSLTGGEVVDTLARLDLLELAGESPWGEPDDEFDVYPIDWDAVEEPLGDQDELPEVDRDSERWDRVREELRDRLRLGAGTPPPADPDALAWYQPIHYFGHSWGIYVRESSVLWMAEYILQALPGHRRDDDDAVRGALRVGLAVLYLHEAVHHRVESLAIGLEIIEARKRYTPYSDKVFKPLLRDGSDDLLEEALATAESYRRLRERVYRRGVPDDVRNSARAQLKVWFETLPPGYRKAQYFFAGYPFESGLDELCSQIQEATASPSRDRREWRLASSLHRQLFNYKAVTWVVVPVGATPIIPWFDEERIRRLSISSRQFERRLKKRYGYQVKAGGKHQRLMSEGHPTLILPANRESLSHVVASQCRRQSRVQLRTRDGGGRPEGLTGTTIRSDHRRLSDASFGTEDCWKVALAAMPSTLLLRTILDLEQPRCLGRTAARVLPVRESSHGRLATRGDVKSALRWWWWRGVSVTICRPCADAALPLGAREPA